MDFQNLIQEATISVVSVVSLVYVTFLFIRHIKEERELSREVARESSEALREVEREVRTKVLDQLSQNTIVMNDTVRSHERLIQLIDKNIYVQTDNRNR